VLKYLTLPQVRAALNAHGIPISHRTILNWIERGTLPAVRVGHRWYVAPAAVDKLLTGPHSAA
jgi:excisionase family DNA binding protein